MNNWSHHVNQRRAERPRIVEIARHLYSIQSEYRRAGMSVTVLAVIGDDGDPTEVFVGRKIQGILKAEML